MVIKSCSVEPFIYLYLLYWISTCVLCMEMHLGLWFSSIFFFSKLLKMNEIEELTSRSLLHVFLLSFFSSCSIEIPVDFHSFLLPLFILMIIALQRDDFCRSCNEKKNDFFRFTKRMLAWYWPTSIARILMLKMRRTSCVSFQ